MLQIYQSSFFESESQLFSNCCFSTMIVANISKFLFWKRITTRTSSFQYLRRLLQIYQSSFFESESQLLNQCIYGCCNCCKYIKVPFLKANHNRSNSIVDLPSIVANISKFLFWKRITTQIHLTPQNLKLLQIYQSSFFESESQL